MLRMKRDRCLWLLAMSSSQWSKSRDVRLCGKIKRRLTFAHSVVLHDMGECKERKKGREKIEKTAR